MDKNLPERFATKIDFNGDCWLWTAARSPQGYGLFKLNGKMLKAHRFSWSCINGDIPDDMWILHRCDNPSCVNYNHLFLGTPQDNTNDMFSKGRENKSKAEKNGLAKLTWMQVNEIREVYQRGVRTYVNGINVCGEFSQVGLSKKYGVSSSLIGCIVNNELWTKDVETSNPA